MTGFGDYEDADAFDTAPADPEQVARKLVELDGGDWRDLDDEHQARRIAIVVALLAWLRRQGSTP